MTKYQRETIVQIAANDFNDSDEDNGYEILLKNNKQELTNKKYSDSEDATENAAHNNVLNTIIRSSSNISNNINMHSTRAMENDDNTMEVPLLTSRQHSHVDDDDLQDLHESTHCQCNQRGFGANLTSKSTRDARCRIILAIALCFMFMCVEFLGGYLAGSLAIMSDAAHLATDCITFFIGLVSIWLGSRPPDNKMSFGYKRLEVMGAVVSILSIWMLTATLLIVAIDRIYDADYDLDANTMMTVSVIGILINIAMAFILHGSSSMLPEGLSVHGHGHSHSHAHAHSHEPALSNVATPTTDGPIFTDFEHPVRLDFGTDSLKTSKCSDLDISPKTNVNLRAAMIHVIGDLVQSFGVFLAAVLIKFFPHAKIVDPLCTILFSFIVILTTVKLFKESIGVLLDAVPNDFPLEALKYDLKSITGVKSVHHLNVWHHTNDFRVLMVHLVINNHIDVKTVLTAATKLTKNSKYNVQHATIQIEPLMVDKNFC